MKRRKNHYDLMQRKLRVAKKKYCFYAGISRDSLIDERVLNVFALKAACAETDLSESDLKDELLIKEPYCFLNECSVVYAHEIEVDDLSSVVRLAAKKYGVSGVRLLSDILKEKRYLFKDLDSKGDKSLTDVLSDCYYVGDNDELFSKDKSVLLRFDPACGSKEYVIPPFVEKIAAQAFANNASLEKVTLQNGLKAVFDEAFKNCLSLAEVCFGRVKKGGSCVFSDCPMLKKVTFASVDDLWAYRCDWKGSPFVNGAHLYVGDRVQNALFIPDDVEDLSAVDGINGIKKLEFSDSNSAVAKILSRQFNIYA